MKKKILSGLLVLVMPIFLFAKNENLLFSPKGIAEVHITLLNGKTINDIKNEKHDEDYVGKLEATIRITNSATSTYLPHELYEGRILIRGRGNTTWGVPKKPYSVDLVTSGGSGMTARLLDMPSGEEWCLLAFWHDRSLMRIPLAMHLGQQMDGIYWTPKLRYVELWLNGEYRGLYCLSERIERENNKLNVARLSSSAADQREPNITGGYIFEASTPDKLNEREREVQFRSSTDINFTFKYPKPHNITPAQRQWAINYINEFESVLWDENLYKDPVNGYMKYINVPSFIDWTILHELSKGVDNLFHASVFAHKDRNDKLNMSAPWDYDLSFGNSGVFSEDANWVKSHRWFYRLHRDENYAKQYNERYDELQTLFEKIPAILQANYRQLEESGAVEREITKWPQILREYRSNDNLVTAKHYKAHVQYLSEWTMSRNNWCLIALGMNNQEKGERMKTLKPVIRVMDPESMEAGENFTIKVMKSDRVLNKYHYSWNDGGFHNTTESRRITQKGKYWVKIRDEWGNVSLASDTLYFGVESPVTSIPVKTVSQTFTYNNPAKDVLNINYLSHRASALSFQLFDIKGSRVINEAIPVSLGYNSFQIPVSNLKNGIYVIYLHDEEKVISRKVIINSSY